MKINSMAMRVFALFDGTCRAPILQDAARSSPSPRRLALSPENSVRPTSLRKKVSSRNTGLRVELIYFQGGSQVIQAMLGGDVPLTVTAGPEGVVAKLQGADIALLSANNPTMHFSLFVSPEIKKADGPARQESGREPIRLRRAIFPFSYIFKSLGLAESDVTIVQIGDNPSRLAALKTNAIQATVFTSPNTVRAKKAGFLSMVDAYKLGLKFHGSGIAATGAFLAGSPPGGGSNSSKGFLKGWPIAKQHKEESIRLIKEFMKLKDQDEAEDSYQVIIHEVQPRKPYPLKGGRRDGVAQHREHRPEGENRQGRGFDRRLGYEALRPKRVHR